MILPGINTGNRLASGGTFSKVPVSAEFRGGVSHFVSTGNVGDYGCRDAAAQFMNMIGRDMVTRATDLPDFDRPPLNEVVLGVQFGTPDGYNQIYVGDVWRLFRGRFPKVQEQPAIAPAFETFGLPQAQQAIHFSRGPEHDRFWFLTPEGEQLIQFQQDRLLHNWRKVDGKDNPYPRFEPMLQSFKDELNTLDVFFRESFGAPLEINQAEVSYINRIHGEDGKPPRADKWLRFLRFGSASPDDYSGTFREIIRDENGEPLARLICEVKSALTSSLQPIIVMSISVRGAPAQTSTASAVEFLEMGRRRIGKRFIDFTTDEAHSEWGRKQ